MSKKIVSKKIEREYESRGISAHPQWWAEVERTADEMGVNRSALIRLAVNDYLKGERVENLQVSQQTA
jgi:metal-responsive CopG/Arc/MetJ family transcriptional regulator